jgi:uncharacterized protein with NRDE domain
MRLKQGLQAAVSAARAGNGHDADNADLLLLLQDRTLAPDAQLPSTGIALARERALSAAFIATPDYGTRACSIVRVGRAKAEFFEVGFDAGGRIGATQFEFAPQAKL